MGEKIVTSNCAAVQNRLIRWQTSTLCLAPTDLYRWCAAIIQMANAMEIWLWRILEVSQSSLPQRQLMISASKDPRGKQ